MNQKKTLLIVALALVLLIGIAYPLYNNFSQEQAPDQLEILKPSGNMGNQIIPIQPKETEPEETFSNVNEPKETELNETEPQETEPKETEPQETEPKETEPKETEPKETEPKETEPKETEPKETEPKETEPKETEPTNPPVELEYDFTVLDAYGRNVKLSDYLGKPIVLNFWASWCGPCRSEMPEFQEVYEDMKDEVQFLMVNATASEGSISDAKAFIQRYGYTFPVVYDTTAEALYTYGIEAFPTTYFLSATGEPIARVVGAINKATLLQGIAIISQ